MKIHDDVLPPRIKNPTQLVGIDIETFGQKEGRLHRPEGKLASLQISIDDDVYMIYETRKVQEAMDRIRSGVWCLQNATFDIRQLRRWAKIEPVFIWDTMLVERNLFNGYYSHFGLKDLARRYLDERIDKEVREEFSSASNWTDEMRHYAALDPILTVRIAEQQMKLDVPASYYDIDAPCIWVFIDLEPVKVDAQAWLDMVKTFDEKGSAIEQTKLGGLNVYAHKSVKQYLFDLYELRLKNTNAATLLPYESDYPAISDILLARMYRKADNTYGKKWISKFVENDGLVYTDYTITGAVTGRPTSRNPNLANIPARKIPEYRDRFISKHGQITVMDISQQEPRILACESGDRALMDVFLQDKDIHSEVAQAVYNDPSICKGDPRRTTGKVIGLATNYDMTAKTLARKLSIEENVAQTFITNYFARFRGVWFWRENTKREAKSNGYVTTRSGRKCWLNTYGYKWERNAINSPIQGGGADVLKGWMLELWRKCRSKGYRYPVVLQVYDEIVLDHTPDERDEYVKLATESLTEVAGKLYPEVPFISEPDTGISWGAKH